ncbi:molybdopterin oxidoreductase [Tenericutes bacterium MO-XQ]|nr:molybdopterin oxidoreductase [Tenericutes bacterium MO-XQ]
MNEKQMICIMCPIGCHVTVDENLNVTGNKCPRGKNYAIEEMTCPKRILTTTVKTDSKMMPRLSVKTDKPIEKSLLFEALEKLNHITVKKNVKIGDVIVKHILDTDVDIIATKLLIRE